jgi:hypothetical protein
VVAEEFVNAASWLRPVYDRYVTRIAICHLQYFADALPRRLLQLDSNRSRKTAREDEDTACTYEFCSGASPPATQIIATSDTGTSAIPSLSISG